LDRVSGFLVQAAFPGMFNDKIADRGQAGKIAWEHFGSHLLVLLFLERANRSNHIVKDLEVVVHSNQIQRIEDLLGNTGKDNFTAVIPFACLLGLDEHPPAFTGHKLYIGHIKNDFEYTAILNLLEGFHQRVASIAVNPAIHFDH
jgi:hypothetical protein